MPRIIVIFFAVYTSGGRKEDPGLENRAYIINTIYYRERGLSSISQNTAIKVG